MAEALESVEKYNRITAKPLIGKDINFIDIKLFPKDLLIFNHKVIHCSNPNLTESVIWVADWRYQKLGKPIEGMKFGFKIPNSFSPKSLEESFNDWSQKIVNYSSSYYELD